MASIIFYLFSVIMLFSACCVIFMKNTVYAALYLILAFISASAIWVLLSAEFLGITLILVYVGAVMVLFLFVIMMLDINFNQDKSGKYYFYGIFVTGIIIIGLFSVIFNNFKEQIFHSGNLVVQSNIEELGNSLYLNFAYPVQIAAIILLVAMVVAMLLTLRERKLNKSCKPELQVSVHKLDRLKLFKINSE